MAYSTVHRPTIYIIQNRLVWWQDTRSFCGSEVPDSEQWRSGFPKQKLPLQLAANPDIQHAVYTLALDLATHRVYTPEQEADGKPVARMVVYEAVTAQTQALPPN